MIAQTSTPRTRTSLACDLREIGLQAGDVVVLHSSLKALGWVSGGPVAVLLAFQDVLTETGTLVVPTHTSNLTDPTDWQSPPVPATWVPLIRESVPAFDPALTPTRDVGIIPETFRTWPGVRRSAHPHVSFAAWGRHADEVTRDHQLAWSMGEGSPLARTYARGAKTMLLGTRKCTSLHLAEALSGTAPRTTSAAAVYQDGERSWVNFPDWAYSTHQFNEVLHEFCTQQRIEPGQVGNAETVLLDQRKAGVPVALIDWDTAHPGNPVDDLAYLSWTWCIQSAGNVPIADQTAHLRDLANGYGADSLQLSVDDLLDHVIRVQHDLIDAETSVLIRRTTTPPRRTHAQTTIAWATADREMLLRHHTEFTDLLDQP